MRGEIPGLLVRHMPGYEVRSVDELGEWLDHAAHEVNGELIVRVSREADPARHGEATRREANLLAAVAGLSTLPALEPRSSPTSRRAPLGTSSSLAFP